MTNPGASVAAMPGADEMPWEDRGVASRVGVGSGRRRRCTRGRRSDAIAPCAIAILVAAGVSIAWSVPASATGSSTTFRPETVFTDVSCTSPTDCTAVGDHGQGQARPLDGPTLQPIYATETAGVWAKAREIESPESGGVFTGVSCTSVGKCTAVGYDYSGSYDVHGEAEIGYPIYATETAGTWGLATEITSSVGGGFLTAAGAELTSVSCTAVGDCTAAGGNGPMYATESGGTWGPATFLDTETFVGNFNGVSCTSATDCTAVGDDESYDGIYGFYSPSQPISATETAGTWGTPAEIAAPGGSTGSFDAVSCTLPQRAPPSGFGEPRRRPDLRNRRCRLMGGGDRGPRAGQLRISLRCQLHLRHGLHGGRRQHDPGFRHRRRRVDPRDQDRWCVELGRRGRRWRILRRQLHVVLGVHHGRLLRLVRLWSERLYWSER